jgi:hypothetical protein
MRGIKHVAFMKIFARSWPLLRPTRITPQSCNGPAVVRVGITLTKFSTSHASIRSSLTSRSLRALALVMARACGLILLENGLSSTARNLCLLITFSLAHGPRLRRRRTLATPSKELLVQAQGVNDDKWEQTYKGETGGVLTVQSELGEPIHKIATRAIKLWKVFMANILCNK